MCTKSTQRLKALPTKAKPQIITVLVSLGSKTVDKDIRLWEMTGNMKAMLYSNYWLDLVMVSADDWMAISSWPYLRRNTISMVPALDILIDSNIMNTHLSFADICSMVHCTCCREQIRVCCRGIGEKNAMPK